MSAFARSNNLVVTGAHSNRTLLDISGSVTAIEKAFHIHFASLSTPGGKAGILRP